MAYHSFLLTNFSAPLFDNKVFVPLLLIKLLSSIKMIVLIVVNTSLQNPTISYTVTGKRQVRKNILEDQIFLRARVIRGGMKSSKMNKETNAPKRVGNHCVKVLRFGAAKKIKTTKQTQFFILNLFRGILQFSHWRIFLLRLCR